ncbi:MAG: fibronectin type III domain-containing protein [Firmicutes bacterium]|nr:fibronectin type III domain-containing protein [Bacillota bacterium]
MSKSLKRGFCILLSFMMIWAFMPVLGHMTNERIGTSHVYAAQLAAPTNLKVQMVDQNTSNPGVKLTFDSSGSGLNYTGYRILMGKDSSDPANWESIGDSTNTYLIDTGAVHGKQYKYRVKAVNRPARTESDFVTTSDYLPVDYKPSGTPDVISASVDGNSVTLKWNGLKGYNYTISTVQRNDMFGNIVYRPDSSAGFSDVNLSSGTTSYTINGLAYDTTYTFGINYTNSYGIGLYTAFDTVTTGADPASSEPADSNVKASFDPSTKNINVTGTVYESRTGTVRVYVQQKQGGTWVDDGYSDVFKSGSTWKNVIGISSPGNYRFKIEEIDQYNGNVLKTYYSSSITAIFDISNATISPIADQTYTGKAITPTVTVTYGSTVLTKDTDYTVSYSNNTAVGTATVTIQGKGNYSSTATSIFKIVDASGSGQGGGSDQGGSGSESTAPPAWSNVSVRISSSTTPGKADINIYQNDTSTRIELKEVSPKSKTILNKSLGYGGQYWDSVPISYTAKASFKYRLYYTDSSGKETASTSWKTVTVSSSKLSKPSISVTKISAKKAGLKWSSVTGATGYKVYCNGKVVKTLGKTTTYIYSKKGAGKAKYKVAPIIKTSVMKSASAGPASAQKKGAANKKSFNVNTNLASVKYGNAPFRISKVSLSGSTYTITGYVVNNRIFDMLYYQKLKITIKSNGKTIASKTLKKVKKAKCKHDKVKKITIKIKGKSGYDLRNGSISYTTNATPYWKGVGTSTFN